MHGVVAVLVLWVFYGPRLGVGFLVLGCHFVIDLARCRLEMRVFGAGRLVVTRAQGIGVLLRPGSWPAFFKEPRHRFWVLITLGDQGAHLASLVIISAFV